MSHNPPADQPPHLTLDENLSKISVNAVRKAFSTLFAASPLPGPVTFEKDFVSQGDVSGLLGMVQDEIEATLVLSFPKETICALLSKMYGHSFQEIDNSIKQGVGELTNIIYALMKKDLNDRGHSFKMSIPSVIIGKGHSIFSVVTGRNMVMPFTIEFAGEKGSFCVQITRQETC